MGHETVLSERETILSFFFLILRKTSSMNKRHFNISSDRWSREKILWIDTFNYIIIYNYWKLRIKKILIIFLYDDIIIDWEKYKKCL